MKKYMGNKSKFVSEIFKEVQSINPTPGVLFDAFSGTTNVGQYFKKHNYTIISNDVNSTSRLLGEIYIKQNELPDFSTLFQSNCYSITNLQRLINNNEYLQAAQTFFILNRNTNSESYMQSIENSNAFKLLVYLSFFANEEDYLQEEYNYSLLAPDFIWRNFCFNGTNSQYFNLVSQKSIISQIKILEKYHANNMTCDIILKTIDLLKSVYTPPYNLNGLNEAIHMLNDFITVNDDILPIQNVIEKLSKLTKRNNHVGNRMFFSEQHGHKIDTINNLSILWLRDNLITQAEYNYIQCALIEAVALFSNTSATYQAFYKTYRANTQQTFRLIVPEIISSNKEHFIYSEDTFTLIQTIPQQYDILYLDPPYNWRIYDSNYHLLNLLSDFNNIADTILEYEQGIAGAAGENRYLDCEYTNYNRRNTFEDLLFQLIINSNCKYVIISYSDSLSNHNKNSLESVYKIEAFLQDKQYFIPSSFKKVQITSKNFESRRSEIKDDINELLFIAQKRE